ncbi:MAG: anhydro-N-acetylmuramic acid kinase [Planctomycetota bacterium]
MGPFFAETVPARLSGPGLVVAGVLSGTSADGIDVALARFCGSEPHAPETLAFATLPFETGLATRLRAVLDGQAVDLAGIGRLHLELGHAFGAAARALAQRNGVGLDLVASHGQTVWHFDGVGDPGSLQLGDGNQVAEAAGAPCVCDFRAADVAAGGHGAPLSIHGDERLFGHLPRPAAVLNLGGMGNLSILPAPGERPLSFDTGPAGALLDGLARRLLHEPMDRDGRVAASGRARGEWVDGLLQHPFFQEEPPRSTGRDTFGETWVGEFLAQVGPEAPPANVLATAVEAVARTVSSALERFVPRRPAGLVVAGGGVHNGALMGALAHATGLPVHSSAAFGVDPDAREALMFACLGLDFCLGRRPDHPAATGARRRPLLGKACMPSVPLV